MNVVKSLMLQGSFNVRGLMAVSGAPWLFRSAALDYATAADLEKLADHGVTQVIDLRSKIERDTVGHSFELHLVPLYGENASPPELGSIEGIYRQILENAGAGISEAARLVAENTGVTLVHCKLGKDRTGLVVALISLAAGVPRHVVLEDYSLSQIEVRQRLQEEVGHRLDRLGLSTAERASATELYLDSPSAALSDTLDWLTATFGSVTTYLKNNGLRDEDLDRLRNKYQGLVNSVVIQNAEDGA